MKTLLIIGIGAGDPEHLTVQAIEALNRVDVFFLMDKGSDKDRLIDLRRQICERFIRQPTYRFVEATSPERVRGVADYRGSVEDLNRDKQAVLDRLVGDMADGECAGMMIWGDPTLYDSTIRNVEAIAGRHALDWSVIPGISSIQALAARHRTTLNSIGRPVAITTGRRLAEGFPEGTDSAVVMLDAGDTYRRFADAEMEIFWGAYVGMDEEILIKGRVREVADEIARRRADARQANGWIMDSYILRKTDEP